MNASIPLSREIVLIGGGHAHALLLREWSMKPLPGARLTVINPDATAPYTGMLPGFVAGHYNREALEIDIIKLAQLGVTAAVVLALGLFVVRPIIMNAMSAAPAPAALEADGPEILPAIAPGMMAEMPSFDGGGEGLPALPQMGDGFENEDPVERLKALIDERQDETVEVLRGWIETPEGTA